MIRRRGRLDAALTASLLIVVVTVVVRFAPAVAAERDDTKKEAKPSATKEAKKDDVKKEDARADGKAEPRAESKKEAKAETPKDEKGDAKKGTKGATETDKKADAKADKKGDPKADPKKIGQKDAKSDSKSDSKVDSKTESKKDANTAEKAGTSKTPRAAKSSDAATGTATEEPAGPITPPLKLNSLREEMSRPPVHHEEHAATKAEREKLEQLATEINKARDGLRRDTAKLEAMLAARDAIPPPIASAGTAGGDGGDPPKKVQSPLDNLAKAIRGMKPEQAAPIISRVDRKLAADVLLRMPGADAGKVMGVCKPEVAAELAAEIASRAPHAELKR